MANKIIDALNEALSLELGALTQYMWHHVMARGLESPGFREEVKKISIAEMRHAEALAERIFYLGGEPTVKIGPVKVGGDLKKMIDDDVKAEEEAIALYKRIFEMAKDDPVTQDLVLKILGEEEEHHDFFRSLR
ncbi:MAG: ferritin-like domain-containing protein [candidate division KSB1 bacterium]|nr:ferritin-like domain-containing protein [candidate division KSB1 bacterium]